MTSPARPSPQGSEEVLRQLAEKIRQMQERLDYFERGEFVSAPGQTFAMIDDVTLAAPAATIDFSAIPATYAHLMILWYLRSDVVAANDQLAVRFNSDAGNTYDNERQTANAAAVTASEAIAATALSLAFPPGATATAAKFGVGQINIPAYVNIVGHKAATCLSHSPRTEAAAGQFLQSCGGVWRSLAAINQVTLIPLNGTNWEIGSRATLYGLG